MRVVDIDAGETHALRRRVLRDDRPDADVDYPGDHVPGAFHLGLVNDDESLIGVATLSPEPTPHRAGRRALRLRGMAVEPSRQGAGGGGLLLDAAVERARREGYQVVWANGRDTALRFYQARGWQVVGEGFVTIDLPHHVILLDL
ncbi:MAG: GNAT family N-acetyltransferase [Actinomycetota bacterium]|nr:GNAT family N-acetyltransferase [Actinomycetota bacterium]